MFRTIMKQADLANIAVDLSKPNIEFPYAGTLTWSEAHSLTTREIIDKLRGPADSESTHVAPDGVVQPDILCKCKAAIFWYILLLEKLEAMDTAEAQEWVSPTLMEFQLHMTLMSIFGKLEK